MWFILHADIFYFKSQFPQQRHDTFLNLASLECYSIKIVHYYYLRGLLHQNLILHSNSADHLFLIILQFINLLLNNLSLKTYHLFLRAVLSLLWHLRNVKVLSHNQHCMPVLKQTCLLSVPAKTSTSPHLPLFSLDCASSVSAST